MVRTVYKRSKNPCLHGVYCLVGEGREKEFSSVQWCPTLCDPHGLQHARLPYPSPTPRTCSNSCPSSQWCHPAISTSCHPLLLLPSIFPSIRVFSNESVFHIRWPKYWSFSFSISPSNEYSIYSNILVGLMLKLKLQYFGHLMRRADSFEKTPMQERLKAGEGDDRI